MDLLKARTGVLLLAVLALGCPAKEPHPAAGLHSASAPLMLVVRGTGEKKPLAVGSRLMAESHVVATGPALLEFFAGGAVRFLAQGEELDIGEAPEAKMFSPNYSSVEVQGSKVVQIPTAKRPVAVRYTDTSFTPNVAIHEPGTGDYLKAFFTPHGMEKGGGGPLPEGPRKELPAPPFRPHLPHMHAGELGTGGPVVDVTGGSVSAETDDFATALLLDGGSYDLGRTVRLFVPRRASISIHGADKTVVTVDGPADVHLR